MPRDDFFDEEERQRKVRQSQSRSQLRREGYKSTDGWWYESDSPFGDAFVDDDGNISYGM